MSDKAKLILFSILDYGFTFGGSAGVIVYNCIAPNNTLEYKLTLSGIVLVVVFLLTAKAMFEHSFRATQDMLLQQLAEATDIEVKNAISAKLNAHKTKNLIYEKVTMLLPFAILYVVTYLGSVACQNLNSTVGLILTSLGAGSVFSVIKRPVAERVKLKKITKKVKG